jgi:predicted enzyme related to lactoylglutathione lyase
MMPHRGDVVWHDLTTPNQQVSGAFFNELIGWELKQIDAGEFGTYTLFQKEGQDVAGMMNPVRESPLRNANESRWHMYIAVDDVDECARRVVDLGGRVLVAPHDVPGVGRACLVAEPFGADFVLLTPTVATR